MNTDIRRVSTGLILCLAALLVGCRKPVAQRSPPDLVLPPGATAPVLAAAPRLRVRRGPDGCLDSAPPVAKAPAPPHPLGGQVGLWVAVVDPVTLEPVRAVGTNPDSVFPLASSYKQAVLWALLRAFDRGRISPTQRFDVTRENQSLGSYPFDGTNVKELSIRMIRHSDNTATDILHRAVGLQAVQEVADGLGLCRTRVILPTRDWWVAEAGLSPTFNGTGRWATARGPERTRLAELIDADSRRYRADYLQRQLDGYFDHRYDPTRSLLTMNVSTPYEFGTLLAAEFLKPGLSARARAWQREVMALGYGRSALQLQREAKVAWFGGKGGNGWRILTYTGFVELKDGRKVVYAYMQNGSDQTYTMPQTRRAFAWINAGIAAVLTPAP
nr:serine hydrolase [Deinococcus sp.]